MQPGPPRTLNFRRSAPPWSRSRFSTRRSGTPPRRPPAPQPAPSSWQYPGLPALGPPTRPRGRGPASPAQRSKSARLSGSEQVPTPPPCLGVAHPPPHQSACQPAFPGPQQCN